jgi:hypothetical protein
VFNPKLEKYQRILAFDKYWEGYDVDGTVPDTPTTVYWYAQASEDIQPKLKEVASRAFLAVHGSGYGRVDMRTETIESSDPIVLEVNANCGVSFNLNEFTSTVGEVSLLQLVLLYINFERLFNNYVYRFCACQMTLQTGLPMT